MRDPLGLGQHRQIFQADRDKCAVYRLPRPEFFEQVEKSEPGGLIRLLVAVLRRVSASRIDQHSLVRQEPVTITGARDAAQRLLPKSIGEREFKTGIGQCGGLPCSGWPNEQVPGKLVEILLAAAVGAA